MKYITTSDAATIASKCYGIHIQVNAALTGTLTVTDGGTTIAVITNPTVGSYYRYWGFTGEVVVTASTDCNVTVSVLNRQ